MATISEDYVSFETAKLLKEKGFDIPCMGRYSVRSKEFHLDCTRLCNNGGLFECSAPTLQMVMKWLREVHKYFIEIRYSFEGESECGYEFKIRKIGEDDIGVWSLNDELYSSYEQAVDIAIKYCLENLI